MLRQVAAGGRTVVMTSHDLARAADLASRFDVLSRGVIAASVPARPRSPPDDLLAFYRQATGMSWRGERLPVDARSDGQPSRPRLPARRVGAVVWKDLAAELRSRELLASMLVFALLVILIFNFALELDPGRAATVTAGVLWVTFAFAGTLGLNRSMAVEKDRGCLDGLLLAPVDRSAIYFGKALGNLVFMFIVEVIVLPVYSILYNTNLFHPGLALVIMLWARSAMSPWARCSPPWRCRPARAICCCRSCSSRWSSRC